MTESILMELRTMWGVNKSRFKKRFGIPVYDRLNLDQFEQLVKSGHLIEDDNAIKLSDEGIYVVEEICLRMIK